MYTCVACGLGTFGGVFMYCYIHLATVIALLSVCLLICTGDGAGVGKGRTIAGMCLWFIQCLLECVTMMCILHVWSSCYAYPRYHLSKLSGGKEKGCLVCSLTLVLVIARASVQNRLSVSNDLKYDAIRYAVCVWVSLGSLGTRLACCRDSSVGRASD